jgi:hypothetical protein
VSVTTKDDAVQNVSAYLRTHVLLRNLTYSYIDGLDVYLLRSQIHAAKQISTQVTGCLVMNCVLYIFILD